MGNRALSKRMKVLCTVTGLFTLLGCATTFQGKVIDHENRQPIEGAAVVAYWYSAYDTFWGTHTHLEDVKETLTDKNGEWSIHGARGGAGCPFPVFCVATMTHTRPPEFVIFKPGYCSWPKGFAIEACKGKMTRKGREDNWAGENIIELPELTIREDRLTNMPAPVAGEGSREKQREFIRSLNQESKNLGIPEYK